VDARRFAADAVQERAADAEPHFVYCGTWMKDVLFLIRTFSLVRLSGYKCRLKLVGGWAEQKGEAILKYAKEKGLSPDELVMMGYVDDRTLEDCYKTATALLTPLWDDDRSITRLPNKLGEYLASGRPVVTCRIGDLTGFLTDNVNAYVAEPGNERDFADRMIAVLRDPKRADQVGAAGQEVCFAQLDYRVHTSKLARFFADCIDLRR
jgi:glycosyltransferase involved in cell wall biosynthesis